MDSAAQQMNTVLQRLDLRWQYRSSLATGIGAAKANVWSRAARRHQKSKGHGALDAEEGDDNEEAALCFKVELFSRPKNEIESQVRWLQGEDSVLFESFCGMLKRAMSAV